MNGKSLTITFALLCGMIVCALGAKPITLEVQQQTDEMQKRLARKNYTIEVDMAASMMGISAPAYSLVKIKNDTVTSGLVYWGTGGNNTFGQDAMYRFIGPISNYSITRGKKNKVYVTFNATEPRGKYYTFKMEVFYNGTTFMTVSGTNLQPMRYRGVIVEKKVVNQEL